MNSTQSSHRNGVLLVCLSAAVFSLAGIFTNGVTTDSWGIIFWRGLAASIFTTVYMVACGQLRQEVQAFGKPALAVVLIGAVGTAAFIPAFKHSSVADVTLIYASAPFVAAALSWVFIREAPTRVTLMASVAAFLGVLIIVSSSAGAGKLQGNALALVMTLMMSGVIVIYRKWPATTAALPAALSSVLLLPVALLFGDPFSVLLSELPILILFGAIFAVASVTLSEGARRLPSTETALLSALETPLAPLLAFLILREIPTTELLVGGLIIFTAVLWSQTRAEV